MKKDSRKEEDLIAAKDRFSCFEKAIDGIQHQAIIWQQKTL